MRTRNLLKSIAFTLATCGMLVPQYAALAADVAPRSAASAPAVSDVALSGDGKLLGQVVNPDGVPVADATVVLHRDATEVASAKTNEAGYFAVSNLRGGNYQLTSGETGGVYRVWTADSAPPAARSGVLLVRGQNVARGQNGGGISRGTMVMLGVTGAIVTAGVITQENGSGS